MLGRPESQLQQAKRGLTVSPCALALLIVIAILLAGIFGLMLAFVSAAIPVLRHMQPIMSGINGESFMAAGRVMVKAEKMLDAFAIEDLQLVPSDIPSLVRSLLETDLAPLAGNLTTIAEKTIASLKGMTIKPGEGGESYADIATVMSLSQSVSSYLKQWEPPSYANNVSEDPWHGLPSMIFGKSPIAWLYDQADPTKISALGSTCLAFKTQLAGTGLLSAAYHTYHYNDTTGMIDIGGVQSLIDPYQQEQVLDSMTHICTAMAQASNKEQHVV